MRTTTVNGIKSGHATITPECREGRGVEGAFDEAVRRLRERYMELMESSNPPKLARNQAIVHLVLTVDYPEWAEARRAETEGDDGE